MKVQIVHISDLHFKNDAENRTRVQHLLTDLKSVLTEAKRYVAFTGDLIHSGDENHYDLLFDILIGPLVAEGIEVLVVPGNHDIQRSVANETKCAELVSDRSGAYLFNGNGSDSLESPFGGADPLENYRGLEDVLGPYDQQHYFGYLTNRESISFVGLNTTWLSCVRTDGTSDRNLLRVEPTVVKRLVKQVPSGALRVALMHHPLGWLDEAARDELNALLIEDFDLVLFGHVHSTDAGAMTRDQSDCLFMQSPPLRAGWSLGSNGYSIVTADTNARAFKIVYRSYSSARREFVSGEEFSPNGTRFPRKRDESHFIAEDSGVDNLVNRYMAAAPFDYTDWHRSNIRAKTKTAGGFVTPKSVRLQSDGTDTIKGPPQSITDLIAHSSSDQFYIAPLDAGSTTSAYLAFKAISETYSNHETVPAFFDASLEKINRASILRAVAHSCLGGYSHTDVEQLAGAGKITLVIDGVCLSDPDHFNLLRDTIAKHLPLIRIIVFVTTEKMGVSGQGSTDLQLSIERDEIYELAQMDVADIRDMVSTQRDDLKSEALDVVVTHVVDSFRQMDEPIFASSVAVILDTLKQDPEFKPINKARLIERYVECLLGRFDIEDVREGTFSSNDKIDLLSFVARNFLEADLTSVEESQWNAILESYEKAYLLDLPNGLLEEFLTKGILTIDCGRITFRGDHMYTFFIARQMKSDEEFAASMVENHGIFRHHREVVVYAELEGTNIKKVLDDVHNLLTEVEVGILEAYSREGVDLTVQWAETCAEEKHSSDSFDDAADSLNRTSPNQKDADRADDAELGQIDRRRGVAQRTDVREAEARFLVAMKLYSLLIKNGMQVLAADKLRHLTRLFEFADLWVGVMCARRDIIGRYPVVIAGGVRYVNPQAGVDAEKSMQNFKYDAPNSISRVLSGALGNPQLSPALREILPKLDPLHALFARDALLEIPGQKNATAYLKSVASIDDRVLATSSLRTLRSKYLGSSRSKERREHFDGIVSEIGRFRSGTAKLDVKGLEKSRMVHDLRESAVKNKKTDQRD